ncbi:hypothetical protein NUV89_20870 [Pseudomonas sp. 18.1.10]|uniref:hypothetical protein n=1 Tax=Pseudomonas sp. 18.1.10 TaxID=2969302 RepID=UPI00214FA69B|nr:hypothetical protein [Pseudomonas sp. 18.1.10]MCR4540842.1 hypothetical protein [Pseudomonas sp. 18.1.10]
MSEEHEEALEEDLNDPGNEDPGSLMDDAEVPLKDGRRDQVCIQECSAPTLTLNWC